MRGLSDMQIAGILALVAALVGLLLCLVAWAVCKWIGVPFPGWVWAVGPFGLAAVAGGFGLFLAWSGP